MCMVDSADGSVQFYDARTRRAGKDHVCAECRRTIKQGELHEVTTAMWERYEGPQRFRTCLQCTMARRWLVNECGGWLHQGVLEDLEEHFREEGWSYRGAKALGLGRLIVGMRRKWQKKDGTLMPIPRVTNGSTQA